MGRGQQPRQARLDPVPKLNVHARQRIRFVLRLTHGVPSSMARFQLQFTRQVAGGLCGSDSKTVERGVAPAFFQAWRDQNGRSIQSEATAGMSVREENQTAPGWKEKETGQRQRPSYRKWH